MPNVTISLNDEILQASRSYAKRHGVSLNALIRRMLEQTVCREGTDWLDECFEKMDRLGVNSKGRTWTRDELYDL